MEEAKDKVTVTLTHDEVKLLAEAVRNLTYETRMEKNDSEELYSYYKICAQDDEDKMLMRKQQGKSTGTIEKRIKEDRELMTKYLNKEEQLERKLNMLDDVDTILLCLSMQQNN